MTQTKPPWERRGGHSVLLPLAEAGYRFAQGLRRFGYGVGLLRRRSATLPVICVGNITVGGTGKTPAVIALCEKLRSMGAKPAVISRGHGAKKSKSEIRRVEPESADWQRFGDEPLLIARALGDVPVYIGVDRVAVARRVAEETHASVLVLDDGFQHWRLRRDLDIVLLDATDPLGNGKLTPAGPLREPVHALHRAGAVILTKANLAEGVSDWQIRLANQIAAPVFQATHRPARVWNCQTEEGRPVEALRDRHVVAVSGLARNETFPPLLRSLGAVVEASLGYADHQVYGQREWGEIRRVFRESGAEMIVTTAKDAVKWRLSEIGDLPIHVLEITFDIPHEPERLWRIVRQAARMA